MTRLLTAVDLNTHVRDGHRLTLVRECADSLARALGSRIDLLHSEDFTVYPVTAPRYRPLLSDFMTQQRKRLEALAGQFTSPTRALLTRGPAVNSILEAAGSRRSQYELVVVGTHGRTGLKRLLMGSVAEEVIRNSRIPVMVVGPGVKKTREMSPAATIALATDLGPNSRKAEAYAASLARRSGAELVLYHCLYEGLHPVMQTALSTPSSYRQLDTLLADLRRDAQKHLDQRSRKLARAGIHCRSVVDSRGSLAYEGLLSTVSANNCSLVVLGTHGRNVVTGAFFGSTARQTILRSPVPVVVVRSRR